MSRLWERRWDERHKIKARYYCNQPRAKHQLHPADTIVCTLESPSQPPGLRATAEVFPAGSPRLGVWRELSQSSCSARKALLSHQPDLSKHRPALDAYPSRDKQDCMSGFSTAFPRGRTTGSCHPWITQMRSHCLQTTPSPRTPACTAALAVRHNPPARSTECQAQPLARAVGQPESTTDRDRG